MRAGSLGVTVGRVPTAKYRRDTTTTL